MNFTILRYFFLYIFKSKTRQKLLILASLGLVLSSLSLVIIQGVMGGLQKGLTQRSRNVHGNAVLEFSSLKVGSNEYNNIIAFLDKHKIDFVPELVLELMVQNDTYVSPMIIHGFDTSKFTPGFLKGRDLSGVVVGSDLGRSLRTYHKNKIKITSPAHFDSLIHDIPRQVIGEVSDFYSSELPEIDGVSGWVSLRFLQNLIRSRSINTIRLFGERSASIVKGNIKLPIFEGAKYVSWEQMNQTLVWALNLETKVMLFLFIGMSFLIGICITSGFLIFFNKIKVDLSSFWILGMSRKQILNLVYIYGQVLSIFFCSVGLGLGLLILFLLSSNSLVVMPDYFVERNIPVEVDGVKILISFIVPYLVACLFTHLTFRAFKRENHSFIQLVRRIG